MTETAQVLHELRQMNGRLARLESAVLPLATRQLSRAEQAKLTGKSRTSLWRQERATRLKLLAGGLLAKPTRGRAGKGRAA